MKRLLLILIVFLFAGCSGLQLNDSSTNRVLAYAAGRSMGTWINTLHPEVDPPLTAAWIHMRESNVGGEILSVVMIPFYNECLQIVTGGNFDKLGLIGDLTMILSIYGGVSDPETGKLIAINPVPIGIIETFEVGYSYGRTMATQQRSLMIK